MTSNKSVIYVIGISDSQLWLGQSALPGARYMWQGKSWMPVEIPRPLWKLVAHMPWRLRTVGDFATASSAIYARYDGAYRLTFWLWRIVYGLRRRFGIHSSDTTSPVRRCPLPR